MSTGAARPLLVATSIAATRTPFEPGAPLVLLAPWCRRFGEPEPDATWPVVGDPWATPEARRAGEARRRALEERVLGALGRALSSFHGERWTPRETRLLLGPWCFSYLAASIDRWERLVLATRMHPDLGAWGLDPAQAATPADTLEAVQRLKTDAYNLQLMTPMMAALGIDVRPWTAPAPEPVPQPALSPSSLARRAADTVAHGALALRRGNAVALRAAHFAPAVQLAMMRTSGLAVVPLPDAGPLAPAAPDPASRARLSALDLGAGALERHLAHAIARDLPACFLEGYAVLRAAAERIGRFPAAILSANAWHYDEPFKRWAASAAESGTQLLGVQHGGNYGIDESSPSEEHETAVTDVFHTWGWTGTTARARTVPMPAPKLVGRAAWTHDPARRGILFVTTSTPMLPMQIDRGPEGFERYLERQRRFVRALPASRLAELRVRPHREDLGWRIAERLTAACPDVAIETWEVPFEASVAAARLFVCDHLSTTFAEALATNRPTVLFWDPADTPIRDAARAVFDRLRAAGILFDDPESAARAVDAAFDDVAGWWGDPGRARAVSDFRERHARTSPEALAEWVAELATFARAGAHR